MFGFGKATDNRSLDVSHITRPYDHVTAGGIMKLKVQGKSKTKPISTVITATEIDAVKEHIKAGKGYEGIPELSGPDALERVNALDAYLSVPNLAPSGEGTIPNFLIDALWSEPHKETARLIANRFGRIPAKDKILDNGALKQAVALLDDRAALAKAFTEGGKKLWNGNLDAFVETIQEIREFMAYGTGKLANHGPIYIKGEEFPCVLVLPEVRGIPRPSSNRPEEEQAVLFEDMFNKMIAHYDPGFAESGYDRIYIQSEGARPEDSRLYVAVRDKGTIKDIVKNDQASFSAKSTEFPTTTALSATGDRSLTGPVGEVRLTGKVLWVNDVPNTTKESATTFLRNIARSTIRGHREKYNPPPTLPSLAPTGGTSSVAGGPAPIVGGRGARGLGQNYYAGGLYTAGGTALGLAGFTGAMAATSFFTVQQMLSGALVTGIVTLGALLATMAFFEYERWSTPKSINSFCSAAGISVQSKTRLLAENF